MDTTSNPDPRARRRARLRRLALYWLPGAVLLYTLFGFFAVPLLIRKVAVPNLEKLVNGRLTLAKAYTNPFTFFMRLERFEATDGAGERLSAFDALEGRFELTKTLFTPGWHFDHAIVERPFSRWSIDREGRLNIGAFIRSSSAPSAPGPIVKKLPRIRLREIRVIDGTISYADASTPEPFEASAEHVTFDLFQLDSRPDNSNGPSASFRLSTGGTVTWTSAVKFDPLSSEGTVKLEGVKLAPLQPYLARYTTARVTSGVLDATVEYHAAPAAIPRVASATLTSAVVKDFAADDATGELLTASTVRIEPATVNADTREVAIGAVSIEGASVRAARDEAGVPDFTRLLVPGSLGSPPGTPVPAPAPLPDAAVIDTPVEKIVAAVRRLAADVTGAWTLRIESVAVDDATARWHDRSVSPPVESTVSDISLRLGPSRSDEGFRTPVTFRGRVNDAGSLDAEGVIDLGRRTAEFHAAGRAIGLAPFAPYAPLSASGPRPAAWIGAGNATFEGDLHAAIVDGAPGPATWTGAARADGLRVVFEGSGADFFAAASATSKGALSVTPGAPGAAITWDGEASLEQLSLSFPATDPTGVRADGAASRGVLTVGLRDGAADATFKGVASLSNAEATGRVGGPSAGNAANASADGETSLTLGADGGATLSFNGAGAIAGFEASFAELAGPVHFGVGEGTFSGSVGATLPAAGDPDLLISGDAAGSRVVLRAPAFENLDASVPRASVRAISLSLSKKSIAIEEILADSPSIGAERPLGVASSTVFPEIQVPEFGVHIDRLVVSNGAAEIHEPGAAPGSGLSADQAQVEVSGFATDGSSPITFTIDSRVKETGRAKVAGTASLFGAAPEADVRVDVESVPLPPHSPLSGRFVGYEMAGGRASATIPVRVSAGQVEGTLGFRLDQIELGKKVESPDAPDIPLELGIALLRDSQGRVTGEIPFKGDLNDPEMSLGGIIMDAVFGLFIKAATAPFQLLAAAFGGDDAGDISTVAFQPGLAEPAEGSLARVDVLCKALRERPTLKIAVHGKFSRETDGAAMKRMALRAMLLGRAQRKDPRLTALTDEQYLALVVEAHDELRKSRAEKVVRERSAPPPTLADVEPILLETIDIAGSAFLELAKQRADVIANAIQRDGGVARDRISADVPAGTEGEAPEPRVDFSLH